MATLDNTLTHKRGDGFDLALQLPDQFVDGHFAGWDIRSQVRSTSDALVAELNCAWADPLTTRVIRLAEDDGALDRAQWSGSTSPARFTKAP